MLQELPVHAVVAAETETETETETEFVPVLPPSVATADLDNDDECLPFKERFKEPTVPHSDPSLDKLSFAKQTQFCGLSSAKTNPILWRGGIPREPRFPCKEEGPREPRFPSLLLILTATCIPSRHKGVVQMRVQDRLHTYMHALQQWLRQTTVRIVFVENSGAGDLLLQALHHTFTSHELTTFAHHQRLTLCLYNEATLPACRHIHKEASKGYSELFAMQYARVHAPVLQQAPSHQFVMKVTGRYFVPALEPWYHTYIQPFSDPWCATQHDPRRCELIGCRMALFSYLFSLHMTVDGTAFERHVERVWQHRIQSLPPFRRVVCPPFCIEPTVQGGTGQMCTWL